MRELISSGLARVREFVRNFFFGFSKPAPMQKLLVADNEATLRGLVAAIFSTEYEILEARDGREALELARKQRPPLVLLDLRMPELDGLDVCRIIKTDPALAGTKIIILTGAATPEDRDAGLAAGADGYLTKPFTPAQLRQAVDATIR